MPTIGRYNSYIFRFFSNEGNPTEPVHIHVEYNHKLLAKYWILSDGSLRIADGYAEVRKDVRESMEVFVENVEATWVRKFGEIKYIDN